MNDDDDSASQISFFEKQTNRLGWGWNWEFGTMAATAHARGPPFQFLETCCTSTYGFLAPMLHGQNCFKAR